MSVTERTLEERIARAEAAVACENVMSLHCYWHAAGIHREEIEQYWTKAGRLTWAHGFGQMDGVENYTELYADAQEANAEAYFEKLVAVYPEIADAPERRSLTEEAIHLLASPILEVAEDAQTAKGLWYTPGCIMSTLTPRRESEGMWMWERYGADFVYENGKWVYRNLKVCPDIAGPMDMPGWGAAAGPMGPPPPEEGEESAPEPPGTGQGGVSHPGPLHYNLSETQAPQRRPFLPEPYRTFAETYDYATLTGVYED